MVARISGKAGKTKLLSCVPMPPKREGAQDPAMEQEKLKRCVPKLVACAMTWEPQTGSVSYHETSHPRHYWLCQNSWNNFSTTDDSLLYLQSIATKEASVSLPLPKDWSDAFPRVSLTVANQTFNGVASFCTAPRQGLCGEGTAKRLAYLASVTTSRQTCLTLPNGTTTRRTSVPNMPRSSNW